MGLMGIMGAMGFMGMMGMMGFMGMMKPLQLSAKRRREERPFYCRLGIAPAEHYPALINLRGSILACLAGGGVHGLWTRGGDWEWHLLRKSA